MQTVAVVVSFVINMFTTLFLVYAHYTFHCLFSFFLFTRRSFSVSIAYNDHDILVVSNPVRGSVSMFDSALFSPRSWQVFTSGIAFLGLCFYASRVCPWIVFGSKCKVHLKFLLYTCDIYHD